MLYPMKDLLDDAYKNHYGVMAPSIRNEDCMRAAIEVAEELKSPVIINCCLPTWGRMDEEYVSFQVSLARQWALRTFVPVAINLDHGPTIEQAALAIHCGMTSVMIDKSTESNEENARVTKIVCDMAHAAGVSVEAEFGHVGVADEAGASANGAGQMTAWSAYTDPKEVAKFVADTGVDCVAVSIGNKHGPWAKGITPHINFELLQQITEAIPGVPLVMHGGSGTGDENLSKSTTMGICKVNVGTECETAAYMAVVNQVQEKGRCGGVFTVLREGYKTQVRRHMELFHSVGKAW